MQVHDANADGLHGGSLDQNSLVYAQKHILEAEWEQDAAEPEPKVFRVVMVFTV